MSTDWNLPVAMGKISRMRRHQAGQIRVWLAALSLCIALVAFSIAFIDRPLALWVHQFHGIETLAPVTHLPIWVVPSAILLFAALAVATAFGYRNSLAEFALCCGTALIGGAVIKDQLKFLFGRAWPETWINGNRSFVADGIYGFWPLHGGDAYASFPSGHTTVLVGGGFHWLSDTIAGAFLGAAVGSVVSGLSRGAAPARQAT
jgi:membrane-associated phospholipid phosphatase